MTTQASSDSPRKAWARALERTAPIARAPYVTLPVRIGELADACGDAVALMGEDETLSYGALAARANRYARWALEHGIQRGDVVCLMMHNCPDYLAAWLGITRVGAIVALVNTNLVGDSLAHAIRMVSPAGIVVGSDLAGAIEAIASQIPPGIPRWVRGHATPSHGMPGMDAALERQSPGALSPSDCALPSTQDRALYIYTSGTTGLPKAAAVSHHRVLQWSCWFAGLLDTTPADRLYNCLPMYHSVGGVVAIGSSLVSGGSVVLRKRFSARAFWDDVVRTESTVFQYIGELCRFLVAAPAHPRERDHRIRVACGNGLRADVWEAFQSRFAIPRILEFYAATEANFSLFNCEGRPGAIGRIPAYLAHRFPVALIAVDPETGAPVRDESGRCRPCGADEVGEAIGRIATDRSAPESAFDGYTDRAASERKILRDVFAPGDAWFRSGDLMRRDAAGFFHFVDRIGDTFRWRGENVSTAEVEAAVAAWPEVRDAVVYGVEVPGAEGRAGMAAVVPVVPVDRVDLAGFAAHLAARLPVYARPVFVRVVGEIEATSTFKPKRRELARCGFDPRATTDALFVHDRDTGAFIPLDAGTFERIHSGHLRI